MAEQFPTPDSAPRTRPRLANKKSASQMSWAAIAGIWVTIAILAMFTYLITGATAKKRASNLAAKLKTPVAKLEADTLYVAYQQNPVRADVGFKGQVLEVTGPVNTIGTDLFEAPYIGLGKGLIGTVRCSFNKSRSDDVASVNKGQTITVRGIVAGETPTGQVELKDSQIVRRIVRQKR